MYWTNVLCRGAEPLFEVILSRIYLWATRILYPYLSIIQLANGRCCSAFFLTMAFQVVTSGE